MANMVNFLMKKLKNIRYKENVQNIAWKYQHGDKTR